MKKFIIALIAIAIVAFLIYWLKAKPKDTSENKEPVPIAVGNQSDAFQASFGELMTTYYAMRDGFVNWDTAAVNKAALAIQVKADSLPMNELKVEDSSLIETAKGFSQTITAEAKGVLGETSIEQKRRSFYTLSENLYNLIRTVRYKGEMIYHQHCPMAFNGEEEAYWLSNSNEIVNPYLGTSHPKYKSGMLHCGDIKDSLDFRK